MNKLILIDGNSIANRAFYALPLLHNDKGQYTNAVYGFTNMLLKILEDEQPTHVLVAFDAGKVTFRHADYEEYKGKRQKTPAELSEQYPALHKVLDALSIQHYELEQYEADDIIGTLSKEADREGWQTKIVTGDKDMFQLISERVHVALTRKGISEVEYYDVQQLVEVYNLKPQQIIDLKGFMGDSSDNIPGVPGVGEKTALKLLHQFETVENTYAHLEDVPGPKLREKLQKHEEQALLSKKLATIMRDAPLEIQLQDTTYAGFGQEEVIPVFKEFEFQSLIERIGGSTQEQVELEEVDPVEIEDADSPLWEEALSSPSAVYVEVLAEDYHRADIQGISVCNENGLFFVPIEVARVSSAFKQWLAAADQQKWVYNAKRTQVALKWQGIDLNGLHFDIFLASYLLNPTESNYEMDQIAKSQADMQLLSDEQVYGKGAKRTLPDSRQELKEHIARKAQAVHRLKNRIESKLEEQKMLGLFLDLELPLSQILGEMEIAGIQVDHSKLQQMGEELNERLEELTKEIYELAGGVEFNINSPKQLGEILFDKLNLPVIKKTKTGYSTSAEVLEKLEPQHEIIGKLLHYRQLGKLQSTYIEGLLKVIDAETGKVHTTFQQTITATGRLSSTDPNLQNIPIRLEEGRKIRKVFVPTAENHVLLAADYSQIELRILAHISGDEGLIGAFQKGQDIHTKTAEDVFHVQEDEVTPLMRRQAKAVNFGIVYGISDYGLSQNLNISRKEAKAFIDRYFESFPKVKAYMEEIIEQAKKDGYVSTILHRRRYLPEINSRNFNRRSFAERTAMNTPIQGTAADIIKKAMVEIAAKLKEKGLKTRLLLQVHDELIFEVPQDELSIMESLVIEVMENAMQLNVPLKVDVSSGPTWYDAK